MRPFSHLNAKSLDEAVIALGSGKTSLIAGGTDLLGTLKDNILQEYPSTVVNIKSVRGLDYINEEDGVLKIGALTRLADIAVNPVVMEKYTALGQAARAVATPHIRDMGTIGGNIAQLSRCWYFRKPENRFNCMRKGGDECFAILGDNRYHSIFGGAKVKAAPCTRGCPAGTDIPGYMELLRSGNWDEAAWTILKVNPMPAVTGRICARFCQAGCNRCQTDESVMIGGVERALGDYILDNIEMFYAPPEKETGKSVAVVGAGPSALAAAYFLRRAGQEVTVFDGREEAGGVLMYEIPESKLPKEIVRKLILALEMMGVVFKVNTKVGASVMPEELERNYDSVLFAAGIAEWPVDENNGETLMTAMDGVFTVDNAKQVTRSVIGSVVNGHRAASGINKYLGIAFEKAASIESRGSKYLSFDPEGVLKKEALKLQEDSLTPTAEEAESEARRCLNCGCYSVHPSDVAPALIALGARIITTRRDIAAEDFFSVRIPGNAVLLRDEIITEIQIPTPPEGSKSAFMKMAFRKSIDFPVVNCAVLVGGDCPRVCLNAVAPKPYRATRAEAILAGKKIDESVAEAAGEAAVEDAMPLPATKYKVQIAKTLVRRALLSTL